SLTVTTASHHLDIAYEVVALSDGSTVQTSGTTPVTMASGTTSATANLTTIDTTRTAVFYTISGGDSAQTSRMPDTAVVVSMHGSNGAGASSLSLARGRSNVTTFAETGRTIGQAYFYKGWANGGAAGGCTTSPCYVAGVEVSVTPRSGTTVWSSIVAAGGAALNPAVAGIGTGRVSVPSNNG